MLKITQAKSLIGRTGSQRRTVRALGLRRIGDTVEQPDRPEIRGMIRKVEHLLRVDEGLAEAQEQGQGQEEGPT